MGRRRHLEEFVSQSIHHSDHRSPLPIPSLKLSASTFVVQAGSHWQSAPFIFLQAVQVRTCDHILIHIFLQSYTRRYIPNIECYSHNLGLSLATVHQYHPWFPSPKISKRRLVKLSAENIESLIYSEL